MSARQKRPTGSQNKYTTGVTEILIIMSMSAAGHCLLWAPERGGRKGKERARIKIKESNKIMQSQQKSDQRQANDRQATTVPWYVLTAPTAARTAPHSAFFILLCSPLGTHTLLHSHTHSKGQPLRCAKQMFGSKSVTHGVLHVALSAGERLRCGAIRVTGMCVPEPNDGRTPASDPSRHR